MQLYQSEFLSIDKQGEILVQKWSKADLSIEKYKSELLTFLQILNHTKAKELVWDNENCNLLLPEALDEWMGSEILIPIYKKGLKKLILTVPEKNAVHLSIVTSLGKAKSILQPIYFNDLNEATFYAQSDSAMFPIEKKPIVTCAVNEDKSAFHLNVTIPSNDLQGLLSYIDQIDSDNQFRAQHQMYYHSLTFQELTIFKLIVFGNTNKQIGAILFIEESSVKTHRKNIKHKLKIHSFFDIYRYARCFGIIK